jgi:hypothetical protein
MTFCVKKMIIQDMASVIEGFKRAGVIIFGLVRFLPIKTTKLKFYKKQKIKPKPVLTTGFDSVRLFYIKNRNLNYQFWFCSVWFSSVSVWYGYFILKTKNYIVFGVFFIF